MALTDNLFWRRLHSFTGALPLGAYLLFHLYMNSYSVFGPDIYNGQVAPLRRLPYLLFIEISFIFIPLAYHSLYGIYIWYTGRWNALQYGYARNWLFTLQRVTGLVALVFVVFHVYDQRFRPEALYENVWGSIQSEPVFALYMVGVTAAALHLGNGLWSVLIKWGFTAGKFSQRLTLWIFSLFGIGLAAAGLRAILAFR